MCRHINISKNPILSANVSVFLWLTPVFLSPNGCQPKIRTSQPWGSSWLAVGTWKIIGTHPTPRPAKALHLPRPLGHPNFGFTWPMIWAFSSPDNGRKVEAIDASDIDIDVVIYPSALVQVSFEKVLTQPEIRWNYVFVCVCVCFWRRHETNLVIFWNPSQPMAPWWWMVMLEPILGKPDSKGVVTSWCV